MPTRHEQAHGRIADAAGRRVRGLPLGGGSVFDGPGTPMLCHQAPRQKGYLGICARHEAHQSAWPSIPPCQRTHLMHKGRQSRGARQRGRRRTQSSSSRICIRALLHSVVVVFIFLLLVALLPFVVLLLLALVQHLVHVRIHHPNLYKPPALLKTELTQRRGHLFSPLGSLLGNAAEFTKEIPIRDLGHAVTLLVKAQITSITVNNLINLSLEFLLVANDAAIFALGTISHGACRFAPWSWLPGGGQGLVLLVIRTRQRLLALLGGGNLLKVVFLFYAVPFRLNAVCRGFM